jgi:hypothetical protein
MRKSPRHHNALRALQLTIPLTLLLSGATAARGSSFTWIPTWKTGDSWMIKELVPSMSGLADAPEWRFQNRTYDVQGTTKVGRTDCYVLEMQWGRWDERRPRAKSIYYLRRSDLKVVREDVYHLYDGKLQPPVRIDYGNGEDGPFFMTGGPRWPRFPLDSIPQRDTVFRIFMDTSMSDLERQGVSRIPATSAEHWLVAGDSAEDPALRSRDKVLFRVLMEEGTYDSSGITPVGYSLQLWSRDEPWRLYEEWGSYRDDASRLSSREWLIQSNRRKP